MVYLRLDASAERGILEHEAGFVNGSQNYLYAEIDVQIQQC